MQDSNKSIMETVNNIKWLKSDLERITKFKDEAFKVFEAESIATPPLDKMLEIRDQYWKLLCGWNTNNKHFGFLKVQDWKEINLAFDHVSSAFINRQEFISTLTPSREAVEKYIEEVKEALSKEQEYLSKRFDKFVEEEKDDYLTISAAKHKNAFLEKFLQS